LKNDRIDIHTSKALFTYFQLYLKGGVFNLDGSKSLTETMQAILHVDNADQIVVSIVFLVRIC